MEYVYAALLLHSAGKDVTEDGIKKVVEASGVAVDDVRVKALVAALEGVDIAKVLSQAAVMPVAAAAPAALPLLPRLPPRKRKKRIRKLQRRAESRAWVPCSAEALFSLFLIFFPVPVHSSLQNYNFVKNIIEYYYKKY